MNHQRPVPTRARRMLRTAAVAVLAVIATMLGTVILHTVSSSAEPSSTHALQEPPGGRLDPSRVVSEAVTEADGVMPDGVTVFDDRYPGVVNLDPDLLSALRDAATDAARDGIAFVVNSGWRSAEYQEHLLREAVADYGSEAEAARWVATAETSAHVSGEAVDVGGADAAAWLGEHGGRYGLCPTYDNEPWHFELRPDAAAHGCPVTYADPTEDPRMRP